MFLVRVRVRRPPRGWYTLRMSKILSLACAAVALGASAAPFPQIQRLFATAPEKIEAAVKAYPDAFGDGLIIATFAGVTIGSEEVRDFATQKAFVERFQAQGVEVQICVSSTIGHSDAWTQVRDYPKMVGPDGRAAKAVACPRGAAFVAQMRDTFRRYAELHPRVIWIDDDFRMAHHSPVSFGCFCDGCLGGFNAATGLSLSRADLSKAILSDGVVGGRRVRRDWHAYARRALTDLAGEIAAAVHAVDDRIIIGFMCCNPSVYAPFDFAGWTARARNRDGAVWFRHGSGAYTDLTPYAADGIIAKNVAIARNCAQTEGPGVLNLTEEVTCPYNRRTKSLRMTFLEAALSLGLAGADGVTYDAIKPNLDEQLRPDGIVADVHRRHTELVRMRGLVAGKRQIGVWPFFSPDTWLANGPASSFHAMGNLGTEAWQPLLYLGIPFTFREKDAGLLLLSGASARAVPADRLAAWRARGVVADAAAAAEVAKTGAPLGKDGKAFVYGGNWGTSVWGRKESLEIKDALDRLAGGRLPSRVDTCVRLAQSTWESPDGRERVVFLFNLDYDDATDVNLTLDAPFTAHLLNPNGAWTSLGTGDAFAVPTVPAWSVAALRLRR